MCSIRSFKLLATAAAIATAFGVSARAALGAETSYEMISYVESPSGRRLATGDYDGAIELAAKRSRSGVGETRLMENTNLCVAYTVTGNYAKARESCEAALEIAQLVDGARSRRSARHAYETAKAMTNRGVLKAMTGDVTGAASDFKEATAMGGTPPAPDRKLGYLEGAIADRLAMSEAR